jgi:hypothetical protein
MYKRRILAALFVPSLAVALTLIVSEATAYADGGPGGGLTGGGSPVAGLTGGASPVGGLTKGVPLVGAATKG